VKKVAKENNIESYKISSKFFIMLNNIKIEIILGGEYNWGDLIMAINTNHNIQKYNKYSYIFLKAY
jgi:hypothetical protein